jgi:hypothetical protein
VQVEAGSRALLTEGDLVLGRFALLRSGKKNYTVVEVVDNDDAGDSDDAADAKGSARRVEEEHEGADENKP